MNDTRAITLGSLEKPWFWSFNDYWRCTFGSLFYLQSLGHFSLWIILCMFLCYGRGLFRSICFTFSSYPWNTEGEKREVATAVETKHVIVNNYHALLSLLPVWSAAHTTWVSPLPYFSAHCARTLPPLRSLRVGSLFGAVEGQGGKLRLPLMPQKLLRTFSVMSLPMASPFPQQRMQWVRPGNAASWTFGLFMPLTRAPSSGWTGSS